TRPGSGLLPWYGAGPAGGAGSRRRFCRSTLDRNRNTCPRIQHNHYRQDNDQGSPQASNKGGCFPERENITTFLSINHSAFHTLSSAGESLAQNKSRWNNSFCKAKKHREVCDRGG